MTVAIDGVCRLVAGDPSAAGVARELGDVIEEQTSALEVRPRDERFPDVYVVHDDGEVSHVDLGLREPAPLDDFAQAFGDSREAPRRAHRPRQLLFEAGACTIIASVSDEHVSEATVRRD